MTLALPSPKFTGATGRGAVGPGFVVSVSLSNSGQDTAIIRSAISTAVEERSAF